MSILRGNPMENLRPTVYLQGHLLEVLLSYADIIHSPNERSNQPNVKSDHCWYYRCLQPSTSLHPDSSPFVN